MRTDAYFLASRELATRGGFIGLRYIAPDNRVILSESDLRIMANSGVITPLEFINGLDVELITKEQATQYISEGHYKMNYDDDEVAESVDEEAVTEEEATAAEEEDNNKITEEEQ